MSTLAVVEEILRQTARPMSVREIVEMAGETLPTKSKTPDTVVARDLSMDIKKKGEASPFIRTAPGRYTMREIHLAQQREKEQAAQAAEAKAAEAATPVLAKAMQEERAPVMGATQRAPSQSDTVNAEASS
jgi:hypothetical protein